MATTFSRLSRPIFIVLPTSKFFYQSFAMAKSISFLCFSCTLLFSFSGYEAHKIHVNPNPNDTSLHTSTPKYNQYPLKKTMNVIDSCWRSDPDWASNRQALADCAKGFGSGALGGKNGAIYVVKDPSDDPINPKPGTLRYGVIQDKPLWIIFEKDMVIELGNVLMVNSYKTIDGRGANVEIANGPCITIEDVNHVIIHGISIRDCKPAKPGMLLRSPGNLSKREGSDGDGITVFASSYIWIDHCYLASCTDGLLDVIHASTFVTVSNNYFTKHNKVMLLGHQDGYTADKVMKTTVAFNHFGPELVQRMPRVRYGYAHVANNYYDKWLMYAIGGSSNPTILSEGNYFVAPENSYFKDVTKRDVEEGPWFWKNWKWRTSRDVFLNGAYFVPSGMGSCAPQYYGSQAFAVSPGSMVPALTSDAGPLHCLADTPCY